MASQASTQPAGETPQQVFKKLAAYSSASEGWLLPGDAAEQRILLRLSQRDLKQKKQRSFISQHAADAAAVRQTSIPIEVPAEVAVSVSPSGRYTAYFRTVADPKADESRPKGYVEVWGAAGVVANIPFEGKHGAVYADEWFKGFAWSADEYRLAYVAESLPPPAATASAFDDDQGSNRDVAVRDAFAYGPKEDWGETYAKRRQPRPFVADLRSEQIYGIEPRGLPARLTAGQVAFAPGDDALVVTCWDSEPRRLGIVYCYNRPSSLVLVPLNERTMKLLSSKKDEKKDEKKEEEKEEKKEEKKEEEGAESVTLPTVDPIARSPRFSPDGRTLVFLSGEALGPHNACGRLRAIDWRDGRPAGPARVVVDIVDAPASPGAFPGLYTAALPRRCWLPDSRRVVLPTIWGFSSALVRVDVSTGAVERLTPAPYAPAPPNGPPSPLSGDDANWSVLDLAGTTLLAAVSGPRAPQRVVVGDVGAAPAAWRPVVKPADPFPDIEACVFTLRPDASRRTASGHSRDGKPLGEHADDYEALLLRPTRSVLGEKAPLIGFVHGGPHSAFSGEFLLSCAAYCRLGLAVLLVNFRGSTGAGQAPLLSLPGRIGDQDVKDSQEAIEAARGSGLVDGARAFITGGSHGGFLSLHLIGQYPDSYRACVARNPVTNCASMTSTTDIPDWCYVEAGLAAHGTLPAARDRPLTPAGVAALYERSPAAHVHNVRTATLLLVGEKDRRVPPSQGVDYYQALRTLGVEARLLTYPEDVHALARVEAEADGFVNGAYFFLEHL